ncbi:unnamed protein product [Owenia fusiformis]|uniref:Uncharacterized protein n=1 Tax=Owenia fusiformis TaxID=6347 RepID=A0A8J1XWA4_OWEFU|nr:unnamed protein product [Owenia fusiformis]
MANIKFTEDFDSDSDWEPTLRLPKKDNNAQHSDVRPSGKMLKIPQNCMPPDEMSDSSLDMSLPNLKTVRKPTKKTKTVSKSSTFSKAALNTLKNVQHKKNAIKLVSDSDTDEYDPTSKILQQIDNDLPVNGKVQNNTTPQTLSSRLKSIKPKITDQFYMHTDSDDSDGFEAFMQKISPKKNKEMSKKKTSKFKNKLSTRDNGTVSSTATCAAHKDTLSKPLRGPLDDDDCSSDDFFNLADLGNVNEKSKVKNKYKVTSQEETNDSDNLDDMFDKNVKKKRLVKHNGDLFRSTVLKNNTKGSKNGKSNQSSVKSNSHSPNCMRNGRIYGNQVMDSPITTSEANSSSDMFSFLDDLSPIRSHSSPQRKHDSPHNQRNHDSPYRSNDSPHRSHRPPSSSATVATLNTSLQGLEDMLTDSFPAYNTKGNSKHCSKNLQSANNSPMPIISGPPRKRKKRETASSSATTSLTTMTSERSQVARSSPSLEPTKSSNPITRRGDRRSNSIEIIDFIDGPGNWLTNHNSSPRHRDAEGSPGRMADSPGDAVQRVQQIEDDETMARRLQAEMDNEYAAFLSNHRQAEHNAPGIPAFSSETTMPLWEPPGIPAYSGSEDIDVGVPPLPTAPPGLNSRSPVRPVRSTGTRTRASRTTSVRSPTQPPVRVGRTRTTTGPHPRVRRPRQARVVEPPLGEAERIAFLQNLDHDVNMLQRIGAMTDDQWQVHRAINLGAPGLPGLPHNMGFMNDTAGMGMGMVHGMQAMMDMDPQIDLGVLTFLNRPNRPRVGGRARGRRGRRNAAVPGDDYQVLLELGDMIGDARPKGLTTHQINLLPVKKYVAADARDPEAECNVCMCEYEENQNIRILPCFHEFHDSCIDQWIKGNPTCPVCRVEIRL